MIAIWFSGKQVFECFEVFRENPHLCEGVSESDEVFDLVPEDG